MLDETFDCRLSEEKRQAYSEEEVKRFLSERRKHNFTLAEVVLDFHKYFHLVN